MQYLKLRKYMVMVDDADVDINLFALAPGLLRDILSPDWLGNERRRILGVDEPAPSAQ